MFGAEASSFRTHRHEIAAHAEKYALAQAENPAVSPDEDDADGGNREAQVLGDDAQSEFVENQREHQQQDGQEDPSGNIQPPRNQPRSRNGCHLRTFDANNPLGLK